jgi:small subunit ribosomal protein MRP21
MELRKAADILLRTQASPLTFLTPSVSSRWQCEIRHNFNGVHRRQLQRSFVSSSRRYALPLPNTTTSSAEKAEEPSKDDAPKSSPDWLSAGLGSNRTNRSSPTAQSKYRGPSSNSNDSSRSLNRGSSADDLLEALNKARQGSSSKFDFGRMANPRPQNDMADIMRNINESVAAPAAPKPPMRLTPTTGRTVLVGFGVDLGRAVRLLEQSCARNKVRRESAAQKFHERGGMKRKRLRRERWRKKFMLGFKSAISRVKHLKKQGW